MSADNEKLIEKAAEAIAREWRNVRSHEDMARAAFAVFEKAHTPTDDEREALRKAVSDAVYGDERVTLGTERLVDNLWAAGFRRSEVPEPSAKCPSGCPHPKCPGKTLCCCAEFRAFVASEPQGEPSDAQVKAAWEAYITAQEADPYDREGRMRAALRAAGGVR